VFGPVLAPDGVTIEAGAANGTARIALACADQAAEAAQAFVDDKPAAAHELGSVEVRTTARLHIPPQRCPVAVLARPVAMAASGDKPTPVILDWKRPLGEAARSTGGPVIHCGAPAARR
jgi:hypothetical protein